MLRNVFYTSVAAILISAALVPIASAYPTTTRRSVATVTGAYQPISLDLSTLVIGTDALDYNSITGTLTFNAVLTGSFTGEGYTASGGAGNWRVILGTGFDSGISASDNGETIFLTSSAAGLQVGVFRFLGGFDPDLGLEPPPEDTPEASEFFKIFSTRDESVLEVDCFDGAASCNGFALETTQALQHLGPFLTFIGGQGSFDVLNTGKTNVRCFVDDEGTSPCGSFALTASSEPAAIPEPATLALIGLGLFGLGLSRRAQAR